MFYKRDGKYTEFEFNNDYKTYLKITDDKKIQIYPKELGADNTVNTSSNNLKQTVTNQTQSIEKHALYIIVVVAVAAILTTVTIRMKKK